MTKRRIATAAITPLLLAWYFSSASAASHLWVINEVFSNANGSIQFIEMHVPVDDPDEVFLRNKYVQSVATGNRFTFPDTLEGNTAFAYLLLATETFAALPGAPTPDYFIQENFFDLDADTIKWYVYPGDLSYASGELPLDGVTSLSRDGSTNVNSPTNFNGETGSVDANTTAVGSDAMGDEFFLHVLAGDHSGGAPDIEFQLPHPDEATVDIFDAAGRLLRRIYDGAAEGVVLLRWDGSDRSGHALATGVYLIRLESAGRTAVRKTLIIR